MNVFHKKRCRRMQEPSRKESLMKVEEHEAMLDED